MEDSLWRDVGCRPTTRDITTGYGVTRVYHWLGVGTPIVLIHGGGMTSVSWAAYAEVLGGRDVFAVDVMGDVGRSQPTARLGDAADMAAWLDETLAGLGLERAHLVGHSLGGFVALSTAAHRSTRVASLVLLDPLGIAPLNMMRFLLWGLPVMAGSLAPLTVRRWLAARLRNPLLENKQASRLILLGMVRHSPGYPLFKPLSDEELRSVTVPVELVIASESEPFDQDALARRADSLIPNLEIQVVPDAGHALTVSHFEICAAAMARTPV